MIYFVMGYDELGSEFRPEDAEYDNYEDAVEAADRMHDRYEEARGFWIEMKSNGGSNV